MTELDALDELAERFTPHQVQLIHGALAEGERRRIAEKVRTVTHLRQLADKILTGEWNIDAETGLSM